MADSNTFEVIIIGGSYSGLSAAMSLGRSLRNVLIIDSGKPCNRQTPHSHNFLTQDGETPAAISQKAKKQVMDYPTVSFHEGLAIKAHKIGNDFEVITETGEKFTSKKLIFATGLKDIMPEIDGFADCWGISILHCPYCHGYEARDTKTAILANEDSGFHYAQLLSNWTKDLALFTDGISILTAEQAEIVKKNGVKIIEEAISHIEHDKGKVRHIVFKDGTQFPVETIYCRPNYIQHCPIPEELGCELTEQGLIKTDAFQKTNIDGVFACGDSTSGRSVAVSVSTGSIAGVFANNELTGEAFNS
ncbi:MAG: NAD(P)/FAD-dependent oxidoreductase [Flavobacterium lindanitolerans]|uniref:NAD(P)/FAD-dependent oxidoreductase n=1 Tax=Flavobacterium lindanitolerans TaxID=428988 RepID=UPI001A5F8633|nr:NAD(P)/FAD-dependent oxidoreductase [Flavobacterium lindanitolerans]MBL7869349.1 NAD(P)/FAD-dependent oxidoreductase [Flavobacterium lindanitolerans]